VIYRGEIFRPEPINRQDLSEISMIYIKLIWSNDHDPRDGVRVGLSHAFSYLSASDTAAADRLNVSGISVQVLLL
jgi:hypothetical protein